MTEDTDSRLRLFLRSPWKDLDTALRLYAELTDEASRAELYACIQRIRRMTANVNPSQLTPTTTVLPRVAWLPQPVLDEESGVVTYKPEPSPPARLTTKEAVCLWKKAQADKAMKRLCRRKS